MYLNGRRLYHNSDYLWPFILFVSTVLRGLEFNIAESAGSRGEKQPKNYLRNGWQMMSSQFER